MKKIISIISILTLSLAGFAKTSNELAIEFNALNAGGDWWNVSKTLIVSNLTDSEALFDEYKVLDLAKYRWSEAQFQAAYTALSADEKSLFDAKQKLATVYFCVYVDDVADVPERAGLMMSSNHYLKIADSNYYTNLKAQSFVVDGTKLIVADIIKLAVKTADSDYLMGLSVSDLNIVSDVNVATSYVNYMTTYLLSLSDSKTAYEKTLVMENWLTIKSADNSEYSTLLTKIQSLQDTLYLRLTRANKI